ncbi:hypothetical protein [Pantoea stewartii]|uniref:hypothetical protein n=1 Tax=Pantoea stewartii TaxID=66269 RepID=UPI001624D572|nr:hypothetical protein [Pantoea stewartii]MBC0852590.1 hypothetical protein [Pantoea stewartii]
MSTDLDRPLDFDIPTYPVEALSDIADLARCELKLRNRTNEQISHVQTLIFDLVEIYFYEEQLKEISRLEDEARAKLKFSDDANIYPFSIAYDRFGTRLEFIGDIKDIQSPTFDTVDMVDALYDIMDWFKDNESEEGFVNAEPCEYFYALCLYLVRDSVSFTRSLESEQDKLGRIKIPLGALHPVTRAAMKAMKAMSYANEHRLTCNYEKKLEELNSQIIELKRQVADQKNIALVAEDRKKETLKKAADSRHEKNRQAKNIVCEDWLINKNDFRSAMKAAEFYKTWLEAKGFYYGVITIRNWILMHAKDNQIKW